MSTDYSAKVLADSINLFDDRLTTLEVTLPRIVLAEFNTHRMFSRNSASSRAIPVSKRIAMVKENPFIPAAFGANKKGMQAGDLVDEQTNESARNSWLFARSMAVAAAQELESLNIHKQWANRLLEPFCWHTIIVSATDWDNFFALRCNEAAQPEIRTAAELMQQAINKSNPVFKGDLDWHLPLVDARDDSLSLEEKKKVSVARCARVSYETHEGIRDPSADIQLYERLVSSGHFSPLEHVAKPTNSAMSSYIGNFRGWIQHRKQIPGERVFGGY